MKEKGNKFASINLYKCKLNGDENECKKAIKKLEKLCRKNNNAHFQFVLGRFYERIKNYDKAMRSFERVYEQKKKYIARGGLGFKAYYNLA